MCLMCFDQIQPYFFPALSSHTPNPSSTTWSLFLNQRVILCSFLNWPSPHKVVSMCIEPSAEVSALKQTDNSSSESIHETYRSQKLSLRWGRASWKEKISCFKERGYRVSAGLFLRLKNKERIPWKQWRTLEARENARSVKSPGCFAKRCFLYCSMKLVLVKQGPWPYFGWAPRKLGHTLEQCLGGTRLIHAL